MLRYLGDEANDKAELSGDDGFVIINGIDERLGLNTVVIVVVVVVTVVEFGSSLFMICVSVLFGSSRTISVETVAFSSFLDVVRLTQLVFKLSLLGL